MGGSHMGSLCISIIILIIVIILLILIGFNMNANNKSGFITSTGGSKTPPEGGTAPPHTCYTQSGEEEACYSKSGFIAITSTGGSTTPPEGGTAPPHTCYTQSGEEEACYQLT